MTLSSSVHRIDFKTRCLYLLFIFMLMFLSSTYRMQVYAIRPRLAPKLTNSAGRRQSSIRSRGDLSMMKTSSRKYVRVVTDIDDTVKVSR